MGKQRRNRLAILSLALAVVILGVFCLFVGVSNLSFAECLSALAKKGAPYKQAEHT